MRRTILKMDIFLKYVKIKLQQILEYFQNIFRIYFAFSIVIHFTFKKSFSCNASIQYVIVKMREFKI